ncbi:MAG: Ribosome-recycling factor [Microgenomates bacterium OLB22]|nr:MAG: Ribosome-recycling factor [Microgenomates bacterium OLB22]
MDDIYSQFKQLAQQAVEHTREELRTIRTGKPTPAFLENLSVAAYGTTMRLLEVATITTDSSNSLIVQPFDPSTIKDIETALHSSNLNVTARNEGALIRVIFPPLSEDQRNQFVKFAGTKAEDGKVSVRHQREEARKKLKELFDQKAITEDDRYKGFEQIDKITKEFTDLIDELKAKKEEEILSI